MIPLGQLLLSGRVPLAREALKLREEIRNSQAYPILQELSAATMSLPWDLRFHKLHTKYDIDACSLWITPEGQLHFGVWGQLKSEEWSNVVYGSYIKDTRIPIEVVTSWIQSGVDIHSFKNDLKIRCSELLTWADSMRQDPSRQQSELAVREDIKQQFDFMKETVATIRLIKKRLKAANL